MKRKRRGDLNDFEPKQESFESSPVFFVIDQRVFIAWSKILMVSTPSKSSLLISSPC